MDKTKDIIKHARKKGIINVRLVPIENITISKKSRHKYQGTHFLFLITAENWVTIEKFVTTPSTIAQIYIYIYRMSDK